MLELNYHPVPHCKKVVNMETVEPIIGKFDSELMCMIFKVFLEER